MEKKWYVIHTYSGYENKVKANLEKRVASMNMEDKIFEVLVPMEDEIEIKDGKRRITQRKIFPGYVLVEMILTDDSWYVVRNTPGVTSFVGSGSKPIPLMSDEINNIMCKMGLAEAPYLPWQKQAPSWICRFREEVPLLPSPAGQHDGDRSPDAQIIPQSHRILRWRYL
jgi:transcription antitermination factor NusG